ncbi:MAG: flagellar basal body-associated FliL family protein [Planctomycetes bacterium]|jgi:flagellar basal body-associated protein FliL|nr:flagellar basal body-associated FliL family protein [Planctomycetota bacterium]
MAEPEKNEQSKSPELEVPLNPSRLARVMPWLVPAVVVVVLAAGGFLVGRGFGVRGPSGAAGGAEHGQAEHAATSKEPASHPGTGESWYFDLEPIVVNLNEPGVTRYVRAGLTLEMSSTMDEKEGRPYLEQRTTLMKHALTLFLSNQTIEDARGEKNLTRMLNQIVAALNAAVFPGSKPRIQAVLFKEFAIQ